VVRVALPSGNCSKSLEASMATITSISRAAPSKGQKGRFSPLSSSMTKRQKVGVREMNEKNERISSVNEI
jgi:hypothetical protein